MPNDIVNYQEVIADIKGGAGAGWKRKSKIWSGFN